MTITTHNLFAWIRANQPDKRLTQNQVNATNALLSLTDIVNLVDILSELNRWDKMVPETQASKKLTDIDIKQASKSLGVEVACLKAVIEIEARGSGFDSKGRPTILFERHKLWEELGKINYFTWRERLMKQYPDVCNPKAGAYNVRGQYEKLEIASAVNWDAAHKSASWGLGQVMGFHWHYLGYSSLKEFVDAMYESEAKQLDAMCRYIKKTNLDQKLRAKDWAGFAKGYNGKAYHINQYDKKLHNAYLKYKKLGF